MAVRSGRVRAAADDGEPVYRTVFVGVDAESGQMREGLGAWGLVQSAEEGVAAAVEPGCRGG